ncbi:chemotaxis protein CheW [Gemmata sp.]|uniref:chemotaxis protein CheW n=1 Tax=Gemmata sp. TaxID=1914242 RepID=UPI003F72E39E
MTTSASDLRLIRCTTGDVTVGLDVRHVAAVERGDQLAGRQPGGGPGVFRARDAEWPLADLPGAPAGRVAGYGHVVLFDGPGGRVGLVVDRVSAVESVPRAAVTPLPIGLGEEWARKFSGVAVTATGPLAVLATGAPEWAARDAAAAPTAAAAAAAREGRSFVPTRLVTFSRTEYPGPGGRATSIGVPVEAVAEVYDPDPGSRVPGAADHARELVVWRGRPLVVIDALRWVGLPAAAPGSRRVVVVRTGSGAVGVPAGAAAQILPASTPCVAARRNLPLRWSRVAAAFDTSDQTVVVPDWSRLGST